MTALTGGCLCGAVRFELAEPPTAAVYCHCTRCQRRTGTAAAPNLRIAPGSFTLTAGAEHVKAWEPPGGGAAKCFCTACGGALWSLRDDGEVLGVRRAALDHDPGTPFTARQFVDDAASWEPIPDDGIPRYGAAAPRT